MWAAPKGLQGCGSESWADTSAEEPQQALKQGRSPTSEEQVGVKAGGAAVGGWPGGVRGGLGSLKARGERHTPPLHSGQEGR